MDWFNSLFEPGILAPFVCGMISITAIERRAAGGSGFSIWPVCAQHTKTGRVVFCSEWGAPAHPFRSAGAPFYCQEKH